MALCPFIWPKHPLLLLNLTALEMSGSKSLILVRISQAEQLCGICSVSSNPTLLSQFCPLYSFTFILNLIKKPTHSTSPPAFPLETTSFVSSNLESITHGQQESLSFISNVRKLLSRKLLTFPECFCLFG